MTKEKRRIACLGMAVYDRIMSIAKLSGEPTKIYASRLVEVGGGPAATAAAAICKLGGDALFIGRVGEDLTGIAIRSELDGCGVDTSGMAVLPGAVSPSSMVLVDQSGERQIVNYPGSALDVAGDWITGALLSGCDALLVDMGWTRGAVRAIALARERGIPSILDADLSPHPDASTLIGLVDHVFFSEAGLKVHARGDTAIERLIELRSRFPGTILGVTTGPDGCLWTEGSQIVHSPAFAVDVVDTVGAGDTFHGSYALKIGEGWAVGDAVRFANAAAALKCQRSGGRRGIPNAAEVDRLLASDTARSGQPAGV